MANLELILQINTEDPTHKEMGQLFAKPSENPEPFGDELEQAHSARADNKKLKMFCPVEDCPKFYFSPGGLYKHKRTSENIDTMLQPTSVLLLTSSRSQLHML